MNLYPYQEAGVDWLLDNKRALLCDEQGLGKTVQAITLADRASCDKVLIICPTVVLWNWANEVNVWSPGRSVQIIAKTTDRVDPAASVVITTHGLIITSFIKAQLLGLVWDLTVVDEVHFFRSRDAQRSQVLYGKYGKTTPTIASKSLRMIGLTGTPMPNNASELWAHIWGLRPELIVLRGKKNPLNWTAFRKMFCLLRQGPFGIKVIGNKNVEHLKPVMAKLALRRLTREVLKDLPPIRLVSSALRPVELPEALVKLSDFLRPAITRGLAESGDLTFAGLREEAEFAEFRRLCGIVKVGPVAELLTMELSGNDDKTIIFAHHSDVIAELAAELVQFGVVTITGSTTAKARRLAVDRFQIDPRVRVIICNIIAGGVGVTLTAAHKVEMIEMSYTPGDNAQAVKRAHRIGQDMSVRVRCHSLAGTPDEAIVDALRLKTSMIREVLT